jgi:ribose transport system substrate-binding protein
MLVIAMMAFTFAACGGSKDEDSDSSDTGADTATKTAADLNIQVVAKGFQHQFWQVVKQGAQAAADELGVGTMDFNGPGAESEINVQVDLINSALAQNPDAIALAALDTDAVVGQLEDALSKGIPVIGFDSGVPDAPAGSIAATASTDNENAAALAAEKMMANAEFKAAIEAATADKPVTIAILSQDATSASIIGRTKGYLDALKAALEAIHPGAVAVTGHDAYAAPAANPAVVNILAQVTPTSDAADLKNGAQAILGEKNLIGIFCSNEGAVTGLLNATNDGADLADGATYGDILVAGFDAGATQKKAVREGLFFGSVTQDPYQIGYQAVSLAVKAALGESVSDVDTGAKWYDASNMDDADIKDLIYD